ncbi:2-dehydro-3-deoxygalactonokinase [Celeribacter sp.]|uniref:2-dehydro-3-deoxygalactonokinase n=1 Tax=Celeribacter sp. TaxID=1890673 RepID=UPI003A93136D
MTFEIREGLMVKADWIAVDWGTTSLRTWAMSSSGTVLAEAQSDHGMGALRSDGFEAALLDLISDWLPAEKTRVIACGMVGARQGWVEAEYSRVPCAPTASTLTRAPTTDPRLDVQILPGVCQMSPADVMRGEETQIAGFQSLNPNFDGVITLPGSHTKWVHMSAREIVSFQTVMTGEMFAALSGHTVLRHSVRTDGWDEAAFDTAVDEILSRPERLAAKLFSLRAEGLLNAMPCETAKARLSGLLIGAEIAASKPYWLGQPLAIIGDTDLATLYARALQTQGLDAIRTDATAMTLAGLCAAHTQFTTGPRSGT